MTNPRVDKAVVETAFPVASQHHPDTWSSVPRQAIRKIREREILRVSATLARNERKDSVQLGRNEVLKWAQNKTAGHLPSEAWTHDSFEHFAGGRNCAAVRLPSDLEDVWAIRIEDPDKTVPGRSWTSEIAVVRKGDVGEFSLRLLVSSPETILNIEPHVPGVVRQIVNAPGLLAGTIRLTDRPVRARSERDAELLINGLLDPSRRVPIIVLSVPSNSADPSTPLFNATTLAKACVGLALVVILPAEFSWILTRRFGKQLSAYEGAARVYLPGFTEDANPFAHELIIPSHPVTPDYAESALTRLRWIAANGSARRLQLGTDVYAFAPLRARALEHNQRELSRSEPSASDIERLTAANQRISILEAQVVEAERYQQQFSDLYDEAEERAEAAETQLRASGFRIQQLLEQIKSVGTPPDANIILPDNWEGFSDW
jgi:hypothetical protein